MTANFLKILIITILLSISLNSCKYITNPSSRDTPIKGLDRAKKNVKEGRGISLGGLAKGRGTTYEFSTSNPLWRASLETLDFLPMSTVDYSGGMIISDWYTDNSSKNESIKITIRFLSNEVSSSSLKVIVHKKECIKNSCTTKVLSNSKISDELRTTIIKKAALLQKQDKAKKRK
jgi:hypothetical protein